MSQRPGYGGSQRRSGGPPRHGGDRRDGGRSGPPPGSPRSEGNLPPVWGRNELGPLFGDAMLPRLPAEPNPGLVFDRFLKIWETSTKLVTERAAPLRQFVREYERLGEALERHLDAAHARLQSIAESAGGGSTTVATRERFVSGLGAKHPLENGFCFDYAIGVPHLQGSSVKGLCRRMAELEHGGSAVRRLLGDAPEEREVDDEDRRATVGDIVFLPAYPEKWPKLDVDVVNCHQQTYYSSDPFVLREREERLAGEKRTKRVGPHEIEDPVPVFFLTVAKGTRFVFRCASRTRNEHNVEQALQLLCRGLSELGIGAKTALGYGVMGGT